VIRFGGEQVGAEVKKGTRTTAGRKDQRLTPMVSVPKSFLLAIYGIGACLLDQKRRCDLVIASL
jgi:hypothetical protein